MHMMTPAFNTPEYWQAVSKGMITWKEAEQAQAKYETRKRRSLQTCHRFTLAERERFAVQETKAYIPEMSSRMDRDRNLYAEARTVARRCMEWAYRENRGGRTIMTTVGYIAKAIGKSPRMVQRYLRNLEKEGYLEIKIMRNAATGMVQCLEIALSATLFPEHHKKSWPKKLGKPDTTSMSHTQIHINYIKESSFEWALRCMNGVWDSFSKNTQPLFMEKFST